MPTLKISAIDAASYIFGPSVLNQSLCEKGFKSRDSEVGKSSTMLLVRSRMSKSVLIGVIALMLTSLCGPAEGNVTMCPIFGDHMVLQEDAKLPIWGLAEPAEVVAVTVGKQTAKTTAGPDGKWRVDLLPLPKGAPPQTLTVAGKNTLTFQDVLVGDVWICSGQSNMEFGVLADTHGNVENPKANYPEMRIFLVPKYASLTPRDTIGEPIAEHPYYGKWQVCSPEMLTQDGSWFGFSAVGYYFGRDIYQVTKCPVGIIGSYWGGSSSQYWTSVAALEKNPTLSHFADDFKKLTPEQRSVFPVDWVAYDVAKQKWDAEIGGPYQQAVMRPWQDQVEKAKASGQPAPPAPAPLSIPPPRDPGNFATPGMMFNGMISPLIPYAIKGVIWYQGESNDGDAVEYGTLFPAMINDWRMSWGQGDFPFLFVQLPCYGNDNEGWPLLREAQLKTLALPNTGMAVTIDIGDPKGIHPKDKIDVAARLALAARHLAYGENIVYSGPLYDSSKIEGNKIRVSFKSVGGGLIVGSPPWIADEGMGHELPDPVPAPTQLTGFEISGTDKKWFPADAVIEGASVVVSSAQVSAPVSVRYGWAGSPACNLYNKERLPASPFRK